MKKSWKYEVAGPCDANKILCFVTQNFMKEDPLVRSLLPRGKSPFLEKLFRASIDQGMTVVAKKCCDSQDIVGVSINDESCKDEGLKLCKMSNDIECCDLKKYLESQAIISSEANLHE